MDIQNQDLDNLEDELDLEDETLESEEDEPEEDDSSDADSDDRDRRVPVKAIAQEREKRRLAERRAKDLEEAYNRSQAILAQIQQPQQQQHPQIDPAQINAQLAQRLFENPVEVLQQMEQRVENKNRQQYAPLIKAHLQQTIAVDPEYKDMYAIAPIRKAVDAYIDQQMQTAGRVSESDLKGALNYFAEITSHLQKKDPSADTFSNSGKDKLSSTVTNSSSKDKKRVVSDEDTYQKALKLPAKEYAKWLKEPKNREIANKILFSGSKS